MDIRQAVICLLAASFSMFTIGQTALISSPVVSDVRIACNSDNIVVTISTAAIFNGMIYPKGLSKNSSCMAEFLNRDSPVKYRLPLRSCNTMSTDVNDGIEYFNTVVVQPHRKLVTNHGRGYHIRCRYQTKEKTITTNFNVSLPWDGPQNKIGQNGSSMIGTTPLTATAPMPGCSMKIFYGTPSDGQVAENVKIGDPLTLVISIDEQDIYGMIITECLVRDGLGWGEQKLINKEGCPVDDEIMGPFEYSISKTTATVHFQAHKFPYTASVYYQCNVRLCIKNAGGCDDVPPICDGKRRRRRRQTAETIEIREEGGVSELEEDTENLTIEVYSGLYVQESTDIEENSFDNKFPEQATVSDPNTFCISQRNFAIGIAIAGLILMLAVIAAILILVSKRRRKMETSTTAGSSIYSGPYTNTAYSHSS